MEMNLLTEAFKSLDMLNEEDFDITKEDEIEDIKQFMDDLDEIEDTEVKIIDSDAEESEDLENSYEGNVVLDCCVCHSKTFMPKDEIVLNDDKTLANVDTECPYCYATEGFKILGEIVPFVEVDEVSENEEEITESLRKLRLNKMKEALKSHRKEKMKNEDFLKVEIETDKEVMKMTSDEDGKTVVTTERKDFTVEPVDTETKEVISDDTEEINDENTGSEDMIDVDVDEFDENTFDELGESYLKRVYNNVRSYCTTDITEANDKIMVEGLITFNSGNKKRTLFVFTPTGIRGNKINFLGENLLITKGNKAFKLTGKLNRGKFVSESMNYNYRVRDSRGSSRVFGSVNTKTINESKKPMNRTRKMRYHK